METSTIRAFQKILTTWQFKEPATWSEGFAIKRYLKKMELPCDKSKATRAEQCWQKWLATDRALPDVRLPSSEWYKARQIVHTICRAWRLADVHFTSGSEFTPTRGRGSIEAKLSASEWTCTYDAFEDFSRICYNHKALKRAVRRRYATYVAKRGISAVGGDRYLYSRFKGFRDVSFRCFQAKLRLITKLTYGSRFSTVPKNNEKDRPINIESFGNILFQGTIGNGLRDALKDVLNIDLDHLQDLHRSRIRDSNIATIDLSDASDSISLSLVRFLLPPKVMAHIDRSRSDMILGPDGDYHLIRKVSSMGNGFTFELMTVILTALCRVFDENATVFGDDIIIDKQYAPRLISLLEEVGFKVNTEKSFIEGPFRESCGANWHDSYGYIRSFDFKYPHTIHDCVVIYNKVVSLTRDGSYTNFVALERCLRRTIPSALRGVWTLSDSIENEGPVTGTSSFLSGHFKCPKKKSDHVVGTKRFSKWLSENSYKKVSGSFWGYAYVPQLRSPCLRRLRERVHWAKYEMYLHGGRVTKDEIRGAGVWVRKLILIIDDAFTIEGMHLDRR